MVNTITAFYFIKILIINLLIDKKAEIMLSYVNHSFFIFRTPVVLSPTKLHTRAVIE